MFRSNKDQLHLVKALSRLQRIMLLVVDNVLVNLGL